jgi:hypothetical protein
LNNTISYTFKNVRCVPNTNKNMLSISEITKNPNLCVKFQGNKCMVSTLHDNKLIVVGIGEKGLYRLVDLKIMKAHALAMVENTSVLWLESYGRLSYKFFICTR